MLIIFNATLTVVSKCLYCFPVLDTNRDRWLSRLGAQPHPVSSLYLPSSPPSSSNVTIDVYLGSHLKSPSPVYCLLPGWLGSVSCSNNTTYHELLRDHMQQNIAVSLTFVPRFVVTIVKRYNFTLEILTRACVHIHIMV